MLAVYAPVLRADFVNWDDQIHVYENPRVTAQDALVRSWTDGREPGFYPVLYATYFAEWRLGRHAPWLFHADSVLLHAGNALLVGALAAELGMAPGTSLLTAGLWALHPTHVESVAWISERKNVLFALFWLGSLLLFLRAEDAAGQRRRVFYTGSLALFVVALLSKGAALTLPAGIVLMRWIRGRPLDRRLWLALAPYVALGIAGGLELVGLVPARMEIPPLPSRIAVAGRAFWHYLAVFLWPHPLVPIYPKWPIAGGPADVAAVGAAAVLLALAIGWRARLPRLVLFGAAFFATNIALVLGVVWNSYDRFAFVADRYLYLPGVGLAVAAVVVSQTAARALALPLRLPTAVLAAWIATLAVATARQVPVWRDSEALWTYTLARNPNCATCHLNLGNFLAERDDLDAAVAHYERALEIEPDQKVLVAFGKARALQERYDDAVALYGRALRLVPDDTETHYALANALRRDGKTEEAIASYRRALELNPGSGDIHNNLGVALLDVERVEEARAEFERTLALHPDDVEAQLNLAIIAESAGDWPAAIGHYRVALSRAGDDPRYASAHRRLAAVLAQEGHHDQAIAEYWIARRMLPDDDDVLRDLVTALLAGRHVGDAVRELDQALARTPDSANLLSSLAWIRATSPDEDWRDGAEAVRLAEQACARTHDRDPDALDTLAAAYAEVGRFEDAVRTGQRALAAAKRDPDLAGDIRRRLELYANGEPYRMPTPDVGSPGTGEVD